MKKLSNPYAKIDGYNCFGCSPKNKNGLQMNFYEDGEYIISRWSPKEYFQGWGNILHGGIQATLMDEIASWVVSIKCASAGVTSKMEVRLKKTVYVNKGDIILKAKLIDFRRNIARIEVNLYNAQEELCAESNMQYFVFSEDVSKEKFKYPGKEEFYRD